MARICPTKINALQKPYRMPKTNEEDQVVIRTDTESENENDTSSEPPSKKLNSTSTPPTSMPSRRKERETKTKEVGGSTADEVLTPAGLQELLNKITGESGHHDSLVAIDRLNPV